MWLLKNGSCGTTFFKVLSLELANGPEYGYVNCSRVIVAHGINCCKVLEVFSGMNHKEIAKLHFEALIEKMTNE